MSATLGAVAGDSGIAPGAGALGLPKRSFNACADYSRTARAHLKKALERALRETNETRMKS
ncbi:hypothetical protein, partial [Burkholderia pseudomallei]|uniref:hypothetical protein n=1 Tax=Burkholderia pseudomallei TaxID=28450 RepID=UPI00358FBD82